MNKIQKLDQKVANMIAAGEVVEKVANVVKELVENAIDAQASQITVELIESGLREIKIIDNGIGMNKEDAVMAFERHATSKIKNEYDLYHIKSLGFRGEAIPSIASVSDFYLYTNEGDEGYFVHVKGGTLIEQQPHPTNKGTVIQVKNLFYNTPARLKYVKSLNTELGHITDYFYKLSLSHPEIAFKLINDGSILLSTDGSNDMLKVIHSIYGINVVKKMKHFKQSNHDYTIEGYLSLPEMNRSSRNYMTIICNDRIIKNQLISNSVIKGYKTTLMKHRYPICVIQISCDPLLIDVNIHPSKLEVRFSETNALSQLISETVSATLEKQVLIPEVSLQKETPKFNNVLPKEQIKFSFKEEKSNNVEQHMVKEPITIYPKKPEQKMETSSKKLPRLEYIGQFSGTYLLCQNEDGLYIIDQHAAAERIRYETYFNALGNPAVEIVELLIPQNLELSPKESVLLTDQLNTLESIGIQLRPSGPNSFFIHTIPSWIQRDYAVEFVENIVSQVISNPSITIGEIRDDLAKLLSCKTSIKANKFVNQSEIESLLQQLSECKNPYTCPHGRPVVIKFSHYEVEKLFKRVV